MRQRHPFARVRRVAGTALAGLLLVAAATVTLAARLETGRVVWVGDGDTITVRLGSAKEKVRLVGIDTPELNDPRPDWQDLAYEGREYGRKRVLGRTVTLERDPLGQDRDKYGRLLRYVVLDDGTDMNEEMIRKGYAKVYTRFRFARRARYQAAEDEARKAGRGRWALPPSRPGRVAS